MLVVVEHRPRVRKSTQDVRSLRNAVSRSRQWGFITKRPSQGSFSLRQTSFPLTSGFFFCFRLFSPPVLPVSFSYQQPPKHSGLPQRLRLHTRLDLDVASLIEPVKARIRNQRGIVGTPLGNHLEALASAPDRKIVTLVVGLFAPIKEVGMASVETSRGRNRVASSWKEDPVERGKHARKIGLVSIKENRDRTSPPCFDVLHV
mmetsp:Transcript_38122/g.74883  ORF Transcript_38122/g.74883 Transcript_38122/m.74883 type:complete len:203 (-) Transcript_38122:425-1033(-)